MLVVRKIKYSQIYNFWQSECEIRVRYFFSISLISNPPFRLLSSRNYSKDFFCNFDEIIFRHTLNKYQIVALTKGLFIWVNSSHLGEKSRILSQVYSREYFSPGKGSSSWAFILKITCTLFWYSIFWFIRTINKFGYICSCPPILLNFLTFRCFCAK